MVYGILFDLPATNTARSRPSAAKTRIIGAGGDDDLTGGDGADTIHGGDDTIRAGYGNNRVDSRAGNDFINSGEDNDLIDGGVGADQARLGMAGGDFAVSKIVTGDADVYTIVSAEGTDTVTNSGISRQSRGLVNADRFGRRSAK